MVVEARNKATALRAKDDFERLAVALGVSGNYAIKSRGANIYATFERGADAARFAAVLRPSQTTRETEWSSKALAQMRGATIRRISAILNTGGRNNAAGLSCP